MALHDKLAPVLDLAPDILMVQEAACPAVLRARLEDVRAHRGQAGRARGGQRMRLTSRAHVSNAILRPIPPLSTDLERAA
jgi:hypothetical protein